MGDQPVATIAVRTELWGGIWTRSSATKSAADGQFAKSAAAKSEWGLEMPGHGPAPGRNPNTKDPSERRHRNKPTPYLGKTLFGVVEKTYIRGRLVFDRGSFPGEPAGAALLAGKAPAAR